MAFWDEWWNKYCRPLSNWCLQCSVQLKGFQILNRSLHCIQFSQRLPYHIFIPILIERFRSSKDIDCTQFWHLSISLLVQPFISQVNIHNGSPSIRPSSSVYFIKFTYQETKCSKPARRLKRRCIAYCKMPLWLPQEHLIQGQVNNQTLTRHGGVESCPAPSCTLPLADRSYG